MDFSTTSIPDLSPKLVTRPFDVYFRMKAVRGKNPKPAAGQPVFHKVAENLYRLESSGGYYALVKKGDKQFRRSLKTNERKIGSWPAAA